MYGCFIKQDTHFNLLFYHPIYVRAWMQTENCFEKDALDNQKGIKIVDNFHAS